MAQGAARSSPNESPILAVRPATEAGLAGETIPLGARIIAVADPFVAMTTARPYRPAREQANALCELDRCAGTQFDPLIVALLHVLVIDDERRNAPSLIARSPQHTATSPHTQPPFLG